MAINLASIEYGLVSRKWRQSQFNLNAPFTSIANVRGCDIFLFRRRGASAAVMVVTVKQFQSCAWQQDLSVFQKTKGCNWCRLC